MFWRFGGYGNISSIDTLLDKPDCTLEEILDENDVEQELKVQNAKLIEFLRDQVILGKLLRYVVAPKPTPLPKESSSPESDKFKGTGLFGTSRSRVRSKSRGPDEDQELREEKWRRYCFVSTQLLSSDVWSIGESLLENTDLLHEFWGFIKRPAPIDNTQAGYFTKVNESLLEKKPAEMIEFFKSVDNVLDNIVKHVDCPVIMDLLLKVISMEKEPIPSVVDWLQSQDLVPKLLSYITSEHHATVQTATGDFLKAIITISANATGQDATVIGPNELTRQLVSQECIDNLLSEMLKGGNPLTVGVGIVIEVIRKNNSDYDQDTQIGPEPKSTDPIYLGSLLRTFASHIGDFMDLLKSPNHTVASETGIARVPRRDLRTAWGSKIEPLGFDRFKTCELMAELLHCSNMGLLNERGSEVEIEKRDAERARLKSEGKLTADRPAQDTGDVSSPANVGSPGYAMDDSGSPIGGSPETVRASDAVASGLEEDFEKVTLSEADAEPAQGEESGQTRAQSQESSDQPQKAPDLQKNDTDDTPAPLFASRKSESQPSEEEAEEPGRPDLPPRNALSHEPEMDLDNTGPGIQREQDGSPVVGDLLKMMFVEHRVVPTILDYFFRFPWNNFLHNVVYDVVQQVFNGAMDRGFNRTLAVDLFETGRITERIVQGQQESDKVQNESNLRLGYMGHLTLIAEEVCKFCERQPPEELGQAVLDFVTSSDWITYAETTLAETRERDNAVLGGVRPDSAVGPRQAVLNAVNAAQGGFSTGSNALANAGLGSGGLDSLDLSSIDDAGYGGANAGNSLLSGFGSSDDEDEDELEEADLGGDASEDLPQSRLDDDDKDQATQSETPAIPAPLAITPSRARRQLAARLAEKQKRSTGAASGHGDAAAEGHYSSSQSALEAEGDISTAFSTSPHRMRTGFDDARHGTATNVDFPDVDAGDEGSGDVGGFADDFTGFGAEDEEFNSDEEALISRRGEAGHGYQGQGSDDDLDQGQGNDSDNETPGEHGLRRETTREALARRPLDDDDDDSSDEDADAGRQGQTFLVEPQPAAPKSPLRSHKRAGSLTAVAEGGSPKSAAAEAGRRLGMGQRSQSHSSYPLHYQSGSGAGAAGALSADAKRREQERLLQQWGFQDPGLSTQNLGAEDDDDDDEDDEPVSMGSKYLARRRTGSR